MKNLKVYLPLLLVVSLVFSPFGFKAFAYTGGYLDGIPTTTGKTEATDNNDSTYLTIGGGKSGQPTGFKYNLKAISTIKSFSMKANANGLVQVILYDSSGVVLYKSGGWATGTGDNTIDIPSINGVASVSIALNTASEYFTLPIYEFNVYGVKHAEVSNLKATSSFKTISLSWDDLSSNTDLTNYKIYKDGNFLKTLDRSTHSYNDDGLDSNTTHSYKVTAVYNDGFETTGSTISARTLKEIPDNVTDFSLAHYWNRVDLSWKNPTETFSKVNIYRDGVIIGETTNDYYTDLNVDPGSSYEYTIKSVSSYNGLESDGVTQKTTTDNMPEVLDLSKNIYWDKVTLSWTYPPGIDTASIYRDGVKIGTSTDGTYTDTDVSNKKYTYTIKTVSSNNESAGVSFDADVPSEPKPVLVNPKYELQPNGDLKITWEQPTTGKMNIFVGGKLYDSVDASTKQYIVISPDVQKTIFGDYYVSLQPVSPSGLKGELTSATMPNAPKPVVTGNDLIDVSNGLLWLLAPFVLLGLSFLLFPKLRKLIFDSFKSNKDKNEIPGRERRFKNEMNVQKTQEKDRHEGKEYNERLKEIQKEEYQKEKIQPDFKKQKEEKDFRREEREFFKNARKPRERKGRELRQARIERQTRDTRERTRQPRAQRIPRIRGSEKIEH